jgi:hypothetical protein
VSLAVFGNPDELNQSETNLFTYYRDFERGLFIGGYNILNSESVAVREQISFVDSKLIL